MLAGIILITGVICCFLAMARFTAAYVRRGPRDDWQKKFLQQKEKVDLITEQVHKNARELALHRKGWKGWRPLRVFRIIQETSDCTSFYLQDPDDQPLPPFFPGQYITVGLTNSDGRMLSRCYSLSDAPDWRAYRITVKRVPSGKVSNLLHDTVQVGQTLQVRAPSGNFFPVANPEVPLVLIAAGIGITPMASIARHAQKHHPDRIIQLFYQVRDLANAPLLREMAKWAATNKNVRLYLYLSKPGNNPPRWITGFGRLTVNEVLRVCGGPVGQFMLCGPSPMLATIQNGLADGGVPESMITVEAFEAIQKAKEAEDRTAGGSDESTSSGIAQTVRFEKSGKDATCYHGVPTILEAAEAAGIDLDSGCRSGDCGACVIRLLKGRVQYANKPGFGPLEKDQALACVAQPSEAVVVDA